MMSCWIVAATGTDRMLETFSFMVCRFRKVHQPELLLQLPLTLCPSSLRTDLIAQYKESFETLDPHDKTQIVHDIMDRVLECGRFLRRMNNKWIIVSGDHAYLEVAQAIQFLRTKSRRKQVHARPLALRSAPSNSVVSCALSNELDGNVPELVIVPRLQHASPRPTDVVCFSKWKSNDTSSSRRPLFYEGYDDYNHFVIENTLRQAMSDPRYTRLDACHTWNGNLMHRVAHAEEECRPVESIEETVRPDLLSIASIGSFDSDEVDEIFESIDW
jgi:hypothetical protein